MTLKLLVSRGGQASEWDRDREPAGAQEHRSTGAQEHRSTGAQEQEETYLQVHSLPLASRSSSVMHSPEERTRSDSSFDT
eukprot:765104-Hanusia_phi.AAC.3